MFGVLGELGSRTTAGLKRLEGCGSSQPFFSLLKFFISRTNSTLGQVQVKEVASLSLVLVIFGVLGELDSMATVGLRRSRVVEVTNFSPLFPNSWCLGRTRGGATSAFGRLGMYEVVSPSFVFIIVGVLGELGSRTTAGGRSGQPFFSFPKFLMS